tara:strand:- start:73 stop:459 length:387 start_codon:yes stop_codon:yes gene_type:complete
MAHFAEIDSEGTVQRVLVLSNTITYQDGEEVEELGTAYLQNIFPDTDWVQTSYNDNFRKRYAGKGYKYDVERDAFIPPQPFPSWTLDEESLSWEAPFPMPDDDKIYKWDEENQSWVEIEEQPNNNNDI